MTSNLLMLHAGGSIPFLGTTTLVQNTTASGYNFNDWISGNRGSGWRESAAVQTTIFKTDLGSGVTSKAKYWWMARADLFYNSVKATTYGRFYLSSSDDDITYTNRVDHFIRTDSSTYWMGPRQEDNFNTISYDSAHRYWKLYLDTTDGVTTSKHPISKVQFGTTFDIGRDPEYAIVHKRSIKRPGARDQAFTVSCNWKGITDAKRKSLIDSILAYKDVAPLVLYETTDNIFGGFKLLHVFITDCKITPTSLDSNEITIKFEECI